MTYRDEVVTDAPLLYYGFENASALGTKDVASTGTQTPTVGAAVTSTNGIKGSLGADFSGASGSYISWAFGTTETIFRPTTVWSFETWVKVDGTKTVPQNLVYRAAGAGFIHISVAASNATSPLTPNGLYVHQQSSGGGNVYIATSAVITGDNTWHHIVMTSNGTTVTLYLDGVSVGTAAAQAFNVSTFGPAYVGAGNTTGVNSLDGQIDEVAFYKTTLSSTRVTAHFNAGYVAAQQTYTAQAPPITINVSGVAPVVTAVDSNTPITNTYNADLDADTVGQNDTTATYLLMQNTADQAYIHFPTVNFSVSSHVVLSAILKLTEAFSNPSSATISIRRLTAPFSEGTGTMATVASVDHGITYSIPAASSGASGRPYNIDIAPIVQAWKDGAAQYGVAIVLTQNSTVGFQSTEHTTVAYRPTLTVTTGPVPTVSKNVAVPATTINLSAPIVTARAVRNIVTSVPAGTLALNGPAVTVSAVKTIRAVVPATTVSFTAPGGQPRNPDYRAEVPVVQGWVFTNTVISYGGNNLVVSDIAPAVVNLSTVAPGFTNVTPKLIHVPAARIDVRAIGIYIKDSDRYIKAVQGLGVGPARWFPLDEVSGAVANDIAPNVWVNNVGQYQEGFDDAVYVGGPELNIPGPQLRPAVRFDGVDDYLNTNQPAGLVGASLNIEFSIKTTDENGTFMTGTGTDREYIRVIDGELVLENRFGTRFQVNKYIADGQWHHVVIVIEHDREFVTNGRAFAVIDGQLEWTRYLLEIDEDRLLPTAFMAQVVGGVATDNLAGELSNLIIRTGAALTLAQIQNLYYEWSGALRIGVPPVTVSLTGTSDNRAKGNIKTMLVLYGGPYRFQGYEYKSIFANYNLSMIETFNKSGNTEFAQSAPIIGLFTQGVTTRTPRPFRMRDFLVYGVGYVGNVRSAPGIVKPGVNDPGYGNVYLNDKTGDPRFINLQNDLAVPVTEFDVVTVMNYPTDNTVTASQGRFPDGQRVFPAPSTGNLLAGFGPPGNYDVEREKFRDSLLQAAYDGANLWINEPQAAVELGLITQWEAHETLGHWNLNLDDSFVNHTTFNIRGAVLDEQHGVKGLSFLGKTGDYRGVYQGIAHREIVNTQPGLTDIDSWEKTEQINRDKYDYWAPNATTKAYDVRFFPQLAVGDKIALSMHENPFYTGGGGLHEGPAIPRTWIVSARPNGVVGKVLSKEPNQYYIANTTVAQLNPWRDNIFTTVCERGTVVRGKSIKGRIFMEFMDAVGPTQNYIRVDSSWKKIYDEQSPTEAAKSWSYDEARYSEILVIMNRSREGFNPISGQYEMSDIINFSSDQAPYAWAALPHISMGGRGLEWLSSAQEIPSGEARSYAPAALVYVNAPAPTQRAGRNIEVEVNGAARIDLDFREPESVDNPNVREHVLPIVITVEARGTGKNIKVPAAELAITTPNPTGRGGGDRIYVYMDTDQTVTLYLKEE